METRLAKKKDLKELKEIWKLCFGDEDAFIDYYFQSRDWVKETAVLVRDGRIASMLTMIPVNMVGKDGEKRRASMLYAIATHPDFQKRGYADRLIDFSNEYLLSQQISVTLLVPAGEDLFRFYGKRGYQEGFFIREAVLGRGEIEELAGDKPAGTERTGAGQTGESEPPPRQVRAAGLEPESQTVRPAEIAAAPDVPTAPFAPAAAITFIAPPVTIKPVELAVTVKPVEPAEYNRIRKDLLTGRTWLDYRDEELSFEKQLARMYGTDLYSLEIGGEAEGCVYAERVSEEEVVVKELLIPDQYLAAALKQLAELLPAEKYIVRTPPYSGGILGGQVRPFGMLRFNKKDGKPVNRADRPVDADSYLGIAYD